MRPHSDVSILSLYYPPDPTGIAPYAGALAVGLTKIGHHVTAHVSHPHYPDWAIREGYGQWTRIECLDGVEVRRRLHYVPRTPRGVRRLVSEISFGVRLVFARWGRPRVVIAVSPPLFAAALAVLRLRLTPRRPLSILWVQDIYTLGLAEIAEGGRLALSITRWVESQTLRAADQVVVIHQRFADFVTREFGVAASRVVVIRNWTHLPPSEPVDAPVAKARLGWPENVTLAVHTGNMGAKQGLENIVDAARAADERGAPVHFVLVGDGGERRGLEERARGVSRLTFVDPLGDAEYRLALGAADVLIVNEKPGVSAMAVPSKLTSYFDAGRPVVAATDPGGITASEVAAADAGVVVNAGDPDAMLDAVLKVGADPKAGARWGANGRRYRESVLDQEAAIERWANLIGEIGAARRLE
ncbi:glycosyltransferase family 4 protein [Mycobacterium sp. Y57]|uniref:glycosyltransferase family 4 protein n=1 Tax=Mycolicibacterium xanthum TaxID=2796469 RepID=UPI001C841921|nr:glycosyltransferase family 4 protein [Mycolicibacterium xanthum]MBX7435552.1 glycosyltransferase family 4 protein [Mycolicibacterium xanthum]